MKSSTPKTTDDAATTRTEQVLAFDPTQTDFTFVSAGEGSSGSIDHDDRGQSRWKFNTEMQTNSAADEGTFDYLRALTNERLSIADEPAKAQEPEARPKGEGFNPYDTAPKRPK